MYELHAFQILWSFNRHKLIINRPYTANLGPLLDVKQKKPLKYDLNIAKTEKKFGIHYKWIALSNTTLGGIMAAIDSSILIISLPAILKGLGVNPLAPGSTDLLLWLLLGYTIASASFVVTIGRLSDMFGRVRIYNFGFLIFAVASTLLYVSSLFISGAQGAIVLIILRVIQGVGGSFLMANGAAILTDAFPYNERGKALGFNQIAAVGGSLFGLVVGGILASIDWHLVFLVSVPVGILGTIWAYLGLREISTVDKNKKFDIPGNITFACALILILLGLTYYIVPAAATEYAGIMIVAGLLIMILFLYIETKVENPMLSLNLFKIRAFAAGNISLLLAGIARGGLQFMIIIWLQGIWLPLHGINFVDTPLNAAIDILPLPIGFMLLGPLSGYLSDRYGARIFSTVGMLINVVGFILLASLPANFNYPTFAAILFMLGVGQGMFAAPNTTAIMNSVPPERRGVTSGMRATFMNVSTMFSIVIFFSVLTIGVSDGLPSALYKGLIAQNVSAQLSLNISKIAPSSALFASLLGYNPMKALIPTSSFNMLTSATQQAITGPAFFSNLISSPFISGMSIVMYLGAFLSFIAAIASWQRGPRYINEKSVHAEMRHIH